MVSFLLQGKAGDSMAITNDDNNDGAGYPLFTFVDENIFKKETFLGKLKKKITIIWLDFRSFKSLFHYIVPSLLIFGIWYSGLGRLLWKCNRLHNTSNPI